MKKIIEKITEAVKNFKGSGVSLILLGLLILIIVILCFALSIGFWTLVAALPIWIGSLIFPYTFKWIYALFAGVILTVFSMFLPSKE